MTKDTEQAFLASFGAGPDDEAELERRSTQAERVRASRLDQSLPACWERDKARTRAKQRSALFLKTFESTMR